MLGSMRLSRAHTRTHHSVKGFTLIEIMIALLIVAFGVTAVINAANQYVSAQIALERKLIANWVASNTLAQMRYEAKTDKIRSSTKRSTVETGGYRWRVEVKPERTEIERVFKLDIKVHQADDPNKQVLASLTTAITENR